MPVWLIGKRSRICGDVRVSVEKLFGGILTISWAYVVTAVFQSGSLELLSISSTLSLEEQSSEINQGLIRNNPVTSEDA
jgi:hypothetical protein